MTTPGDPLNTLTDAVQRHLDMRTAMTDAAADLATPPEATSTIGMNGINNDATRTIPSGN